MTKPWVKVLEKIQLFERAHSPNESNTESSGFKINFTECSAFLTPTNTNNIFTLTGGAGGRRGAAAPSSARASASRASSSSSSSRGSR